MPVITSSEIEALSGTTFSAEDDSMVDLLIGFVEGELEAYLGRSISVVEKTQRLTIGWNDTILYLSNTPVASVSVLKANGVTMGSDLYRVLPWGVSLYGVGFYNVNSFSPAAWSSPAVEYNVTYTGGLNGASIPAIRSIVAKTVLRELASFREGDSARLGVHSIRAEDFSVQKSADVVAGTINGGSGPFFESELRIVSRYKKRTIVS